MSSVGILIMIGGSEFVAEFVHPQMQIIIINGIINFTIFILNPHLEVILTKNALLVNPFYKIFLLLLK
mgnify:CR=1 FL=1